MSGTKHDQGKPRLSLVSRELLEALAKVREFGLTKYPDPKDHWKNGFKITRSLDAALRHITAFLDGESLDPESGLSHLGHAVASLEHAIYDMKHHPENDDRVRHPTPPTPIFVSSGYSVLDTQTGSFISASDGNGVMEVSLGHLGTRIYESAYCHNKDCWCNKDGRP